MISYSEKLKDPRWQRKRLEILNRSNFSCEECFATDKTLHVHHRYYVRNVDPWAYSDHVYAALCEDCHAVIGNFLEIHRAGLGLLDLNQRAKLTEFLQDISPQFNAWYNSLESA